jgi:hypothetical protein
MSVKYIIDEAGNPVAEPDLLRWAAWLSGHYIVAEDSIGAVNVSTVFLGIDRAVGEGPPPLWETMIFGGPHDGYQERFASRDAALAGHAKAVLVARVT